MIYTIGCELGNLSTVENCLNYFKDKPCIQVDVETTGIDPHQDQIISLQLGAGDNQWFIDCRTTGISVFKELLESKTCIIHNAKFEYKMLKRVGIRLNKIYDTMLAECVLFCGYPKWGYGLASLANRYLDIDLSKAERASFLKVGHQEFTEAQIEYGALDVTYLESIMAKQKELAKLHDLEYCIHLECEVVKAFGDMELNGLYLDSEDWLKIAKAKAIELEEIQNELDSIVISEPKLKKYSPKAVQSNLFGFVERRIKINYASALQIKKIASELGYPVDSTNDRELTKLAPRHNFFKVLQHYREVSKIISTYGVSFLDYINPATNRIHSDFWQVKDTGRVGSGDPNVQNIPADNKFRNCFKARPGFKWVSIDYSGQELRLMADASDEEGFIDVLNRGEDLHCYAGSMMFKKTITKADKDLRNKAKTINFGKPYGMGAPKLADTLGITLGEAEDLFKEYAKAFPKLNKWLEDQGRFAVKNGYSVTFFPCKRRRWYPDTRIAAELRKTVKKGDKDTWKQILTIEGQTQRNGGNSPIQGSGADICKEALVGVRELITQYNEKNNSEVAYLICTVHDAIDVEVREDLAKEFSEKMAEIMITAGNKYVSKVKMEVDVTITNEWCK